MTVTNWLPDAPPRVGLGLPPVAIRNDTYYLRWEYKHRAGLHAWVCQWSLISSRRIAEAHRLGLPLQGERSVSIHDANTLIANLLAEGRRMGDCMAAWVLMEGQH